MKKLVGGLAIAVAMLLPGAAFAGVDRRSAGLGAFAVFNQILGGIGIFGRPAPVVAAPARWCTRPRPSCMPPPPPVLRRASASGGVRPGSPVVVYAPRRPVFVRPAPVFVRPVPRAVVVHGNPSWATRTGSVLTGVTAAGNNLPRRGGTGGRIVRSPVPFLQRFG